MGESFITSAELKAAGFRGTASTQNEDMMDLAIEEATAFIENWGPVPRSIMAADLVHQYSGSLAFGAQADLIQVDGFPINSIASLKENGVTLIAGWGYDAAKTRQVQVDRDRGLLRRLPVGVTGGGRTFQQMAFGWTGGYDNIEISFNAGYTDEELVPSDLRGLCIRLAIYFYRAGERVGQGDTSRGGRSDQAKNELTPMDRAVLDRFGAITGFIPRCR